MAFVLLGTFIVAPVQAATITQDDLHTQEIVVRENATDTVQAYLRFLLYAIIEQLEARVDN